MDSRPQARRGNTRQRIQDIALEYFLERGYEKTSLREIADELGLTKAALYYHFKTKEEILVSLLEGVGRELDGLIEWGRRQPATLEFRRELLSRYSAVFTDAAPLFLIMQRNQPTLRELSVGQEFSDRSAALSSLLRDPSAPLAAQVRAVSALLTLHFGTFGIQHLDGEPEEKRQALLDAALELIDSAYASAAAGSGTASPAAGTA